MSHRPWTPSLAVASVVGDPLLGGPGRQNPAPAPSPPRTPRPSSAPRPSSEHRPAPRLRPDQPVERRPEPVVHHRPSHAAKGFRTDIEGLRAVAVLLVLFFHAEIGPFHGGFVGVDVFFVVSGFLITSLLLRERETTGNISLPGFWSRRARRLLSASCLTVVVTLIAARSMLEPLRLQNLGEDARAASLFVVNFVFGHRGADYLQSTEAPSPLLHFWSLAVEEQFYVVWPLVIFFVGRSRLPRRAIGTAAIALGAASFLSGLWYTANEPARAYYYPWNRVWELLAGAGLAVAGTAVYRLPERVRSALGWAGLAGIVVAALAYGENTQFPGYAALLPVLATGAIIVAGGAVTRTGPIALLRARPLQWVGQRSYAIYLWHWPALILAEAKWGPLEWWQRIGAVALAVVISHVTFTFVEDPVRRSAWFGSAAPRGLLLGAALVATGVVASVVSLNAKPDLTGGGDAAAITIVPVDTTVVPGSDDETSSDASDTDTDSRTDDGDTASDEPTATAPPIRSLDALESAAGPTMEEAALATLVPDNLRPSLSEVRGDLPAIYDDGCLLPESGRITADDCVYGDPGSDTTVVLAGDSHAAQWFPALHEAATRRGWRLVVLAKRGCPAADFPTYGTGNRERKECAPWREKVAERLAEEQPDLLVVTSYRYRLTKLDAAAGSDEVWQAALEETLGAWRPLATEMLVLSDTPNPTDDIPQCLSANLSDVTDCVRDRDDADKADILAAERAAAKAAGATFVVTSNWLCGDATCPAIAGDLLLYRDDNHITATASEFLTPFIEAAAAPLLSS